MYQAVLHIIYCRLCHTDALAEAEIIASLDLLQEILPHPLHLLLVTLETAGYQLQDTSDLLWWLGGQHVAINTLCDIIYIPLRDKKREGKIYNGRIYGWNSC